MSNPISVNRIGHTSITIEWVGVQADQSFHGLCRSLSLDAPCDAAMWQFLTWPGRLITEHGPTKEGIDLVRDIDLFLSGGPVPEEVKLLELDLKSPIDITWLRQVTRLFWKVQVPLTDDCIANTSYAAARRIACSGRHLPESIYFHRAKRIIALLFEKIPVPYGADLRYVCGPGSVAEGSWNLREKLADHSWFRQLSPYFQLSDLFGDTAHDIDFTVHRHPITRMCLVPKDVRGPRVISSEPNIMMRVQQGLKNYIQPRLERITEMEFSSQMRHRALLYDDSYSSLDLSDASDYVSRRLVWNLFPEPWRRILFAARSRFISSEGTLYPIRSFAPMGSALCFPVESIVHWAAVKAALLDCPHRKHDRFSVYGDDLIVPSFIAGTVMTALRHLGLSPNERKCFIARPFRESCGLDLFNRVDVTPAYCRFPISTVVNERVALSLTIVQNKLYYHQLYNAAAYLRSLIRRYHSGIPDHDDVRERAYCYCATPTPTQPRLSWDWETQQYAIRARCLVPLTSKGYLTDQEALIGSLGLGLRTTYCLERPNSFVVRWRSCRFG